MKAIRQIERVCTYARTYIHTYILSFPRIKIIEIDLLDKTIPNTTIHFRYL